MDLFLSNLLAATSSSLRLSTLTSGLGTLTALASDNEGKDDPLFGGDVDVAVKVVGGVTMALKRAVMMEEEGVGVALRCLKVVSGTIDVDEVLKGIGKGTNVLEMCVKVLVTQWDLAVQGNEGVEACALEILMDYGCVNGCVDLHHVKLRRLPGELAKLGKGKPKGAQVAVCNAVQIFSDVDVGVLASTPNMIGNIVNKLKEREGGAGGLEITLALTGAVWNFAMAQEGVVKWDAAVVGVMVEVAEDEKCGGEIVKNAAAAIYNLVQCDVINLEMFLQSTPDVVGRIGALVQTLQGKGGGLEGEEKEDLESAVKYLKDSLDTVVGKGVMDEKVVPAVADKVLDDGVDEVVREMEDERERVRVAQLEAAAQQEAAAVQQQFSAVSEPKIPPTHSQLQEAEFGEKKSSGREESEALPAPPVLVAAAQTTTEGDHHHHHHHHQLSATPSAPAAAPTTPSSGHHHDHHAQLATTPPGSHHVNTIRSLQQAADEAVPPLNGSAVLQLTPPTDKMLCNYDGLDVAAILLSLGMKKYVKAVCVDNEVDGATLALALDAYEIKEIGIPITLHAKKLLEWIIRKRSVDEGRDKVECKGLNELTCEEVVKVLEKLNLGRYGETFRTNQIDGETMTYFKNRKDLKVLKVIPVHAKKLVERLKTWRVIGVPVSLLN